MPELCLLVASLVLGQLLADLLASASLPLLLGEVGPHVIRSSDGLRRIVDDVGGVSRAEAVPTDEGESGTLGPIRVWEWERI